jgi:hypothetical protein
MFRPIEHIRGRSRASRRVDVAAAVEPLERRALLSAAVTGFSLVNADTDQVIGPLVAGQVIDLAAAGTPRVSVVAHTSGDVASVRFAYNGNRAFGLDSTPGGFAAAGDDGAGDVNVWPIAPGSHTLVAVPFAEAGAAGEAGEAMGLFFTVKGTAGTSDGGLPDAGAANAAPEIRIVSPGAGERAAPGNYVLRVETIDPEGSVSKVEYFADGASIGASSAAPFMLSWNDVPAGTYVLTAVAHDDRGAATTSAAVTVKLLAPAAGRTIHVSAADGSDANAGDSAGKALKTIAAAAELARPGDTVLIGPGSYKESVELRHGGSAAKPITFAARLPGTVMLDGRDSDGKVRRAYLMKPVYDGKADYVVLRGLKFRYADNEPGNHHAAVQTGSGWLVEDCWFQKTDGNGLGVFGRDVVIRRVVAEDNGCAGIGGSGTTNVLVQDVVSRRNNTDGFGGGLEGGGGKWTRNDALLIERYNGYDNDGPGLWLDIENVHAVVRDSALHHNDSLYKSDGSAKIDGIGLFLEISGVVSDGDRNVEGEGYVLAERNLIYGNERQGILIYATRNVVIRDNTLADNDVDLKDERARPYENRNIRVVGNRFKNARVTADDYTASSDWRERRFVFDANVFDNPDGRVYRWGDHSYNLLPQVRADLGFELIGLRGTVTFEPAVLPDPTTPGAL